MNLKKFLLIINVLCIMGLVLGISSSVFATPTVDGNILGDDYQIEYSINFNGHEGTLLTYQTQASGVWGDLYMAFALPTTFVDNTYGVNTITIADYGKIHTLKDLIGSDKVELGIDGIDLKLKYEASTQSQYHTTAFWRELKAGDAPNVVDYATSLQWNYSEYNTGTDPYYGIDKDAAADSPLAHLDPSGNYVVDDPNAQDWIFDVIYEFQYTGLEDKKFIIDMFSFNDVHASPSKIEDHSLPPNDPPNPVPEPATMLLLGSGLIGLVGFGRKKLKKKL